MADNLTPKQQRAVRALLTTPDAAAAAKDAGVSRETVYKWMQVPAFTRAIASHSASGVSQAESRTCRRFSHPLSDPPMPLRTVDGRP